MSEHTMSMYASKDDMVAALQAENDDLREKVRVFEMYRDFVVGEGVWERWHPLQVRAETAEATVARLRELLGRHLRYGPGNAFDVSVRGLANDGELRALLEGGA